MNKGFWGKLKKPIMALAPMADVTDPPFRHIIAKYGKPDVMFTEFVSCDGLQSAGRERILKDIAYTKEERPIVLQIFGGNPENFKKTARLAQELAFDGIDINMGCPDRSVEKQNAGAGLIKSPDLAQDIITATQEGAGPLPVSVKTRIGYSADEIDTWIPKLLEMDIPVLTVHLRTRKEMSKVPAHWEKMKDILDIRSRIQKETLILGNGDVWSMDEAHKRVAETGCDGVMLGRAIFGNPWQFNKKIRKEDVSIQRTLEVLIEHTYLYEELMGNVKNFAVMKRHFKAYVNGFEGAKELRMELMEAEDAKDVENTISTFLRSSYGGVLQ